MSSGWVRTGGSDSGDLDINNRRGFVRAFKVWGYDPATIRDQPESVLNATGQGLPPIGSTLDGAILERYSVQSGSVSGDVHTAIAYFSNDRRFSLPERPTAPGEPEYRPHIEGSISSQSVDIPYARRTRLVMFQDGSLVSPTYGTQHVWQIETQAVTESTSKISVRVSVPNVTVPEMTTRILAQQNVIHVIGGRGYRFDGGYFSEATSNRYDVTYTWTYESGTRDVTLAAPQQQQNGAAQVIFPSGFQSIIPNDTTPYTRPPFCEVVWAYQEVGDSTSPPVFVVQPLNVLVPDGWSSLPGLDGFVQPPQPIFGNSGF